MIANWWAEHTPREQALMAGIGVSAAVVAVWLLIFKPLAEYRRSAEANYAAAAALLDEVEAGAREAAALRARGERTGAATSGSIRSIVGASASKENVTITRLQPDDSGGLNVWLESVASDALYRWIVALDEEHGVSVSRASIRANEREATVWAQLLLVGGGAS
ncbi:MAG: type II secretion system protein M [Pseudomonadota bacterium]